MNQLDLANKLIFVKKYDKADRLLDDILESTDGQNNLLIYLRKIELAAKLGRIKSLRHKLESYVKSGKLSEKVGKLAILFCKQHLDTVDDSELSRNFQDYIKEYGPSAAAYFGLAFSMECQANYDRAIYNYEQSIKLDPDWYPSYFGLSQIYYNKDNEAKGDHFFYLFEQAAPYNLYGNFETHKKLSNEFLENEEYEAAEAAIKALSEWWIINKGVCPSEIQVYENFALAKIAEQKNDTYRVERLRNRGISLAKSVLIDESAKEGVLYFIAKVLEEFSQFDIAFDYYKTILKNSGRNPVMIQKIGSQFLSMGEFEMARELFNEAYQSNPDNAEIRFCLLVSNLRLSGVNVEEYLIGRERLVKLLDGQADKVEILALLHALLAKYQKDAFVHANLADTYLRLGNPQRAEKHYKTMYELDHASQKTALKYASFLMQHGDASEAMDILENINSEDFSDELNAEIIWLKANHFAKEEDYESAIELINKILQIDPWNVSYLIQEINCQTKMSYEDSEEYLDAALESLRNGEESEVSWSDYDRVTQKLEQDHRYQIVYTRQKLKFLYKNGSNKSLARVVKAASQHDPMRGTYDFIRLLNTNFDGPNIYFALGLLFKDVWQLETSTMWFQQLLLNHQASEEDKRKAYLELADNFIWQNKSLPKAIEYIKIAMDMGERNNERALVYLAHAYLKSGQMRESNIYLEQLSASEDKEAVYLRGLYHYRNGSESEANHIWKPLLTTRTDDLRFHNIKQEILRYYFEHEPYLKAN